MTMDQARRLKAAVTEQNEARQRLVTAQNDEAVRVAADRYIAATDQCFAIAVEVAQTAEATR